MSASSPESLPAGKPMRLQRFLAQCGLGSRRDCEELITSGRVSIDGRVVSELGTTVNPAQQSVELDGERLKLERKKYFMLNKPPGYLCTSDDPQGRRLVLDLFPDEGPRLFTVGRLDENTTGLLIVTNDGDLAQKLAHPKYRIFRKYRAQVAGQPAPDVFVQLRQGLFFTEGKFRVHDVVPIKKQKSSTWVEITMTEGQNREIRRLFARVGHKIMKLERIGYGPLHLGRLPLGQARELTREELAELHGVLERNQSEGTGRIKVTDRRDVSESVPREGRRASAPKAGEQRPRRPGPGKPTGKIAGEPRGKPGRERTGTSGGERRGKRSAGGRSQDLPAGDRRRSPRSARGKPASGRKPSPKSRRPR